MFVTVYKDLKTVMPRHIRTVKYIRGNLCNTGYVMYTIVQDVVRLCDKKAAFL